MTKRGETKECKNKKTLLGCWLSWLLPEDAGLLSSVVLSALGAQLPRFYPGFVLWLLCISWDGVSTSSQGWSLRMCERDWLVSRAQRGHAKHKTCKIKSFKESIHFTVSLAMLRCSRAASSPSSPLCSHREDGRSSSNSSCWAATKAWSGNRSDFRDSREGTLLGNINTWACSPQHSLIRHVSVFQLKPFVMAA